MLTEPGLSRYLADVPGARMLRDSKGLTTGLGYVVTRRAVLEDPAKAAAIGLFVEQLTRAFQWVVDNPQPFVRAFFVEQLGAPEAIAEVAYDKLAPRTMRPIDEAVIREQQELADLMASLGVIDRSVDVHEEVDVRYNELVEGAS